MKKQDKYYLTSKANLAELIMHLSLQISAIDPVLNLVKVGEFYVSYHSIARYCERVLGIHEFSKGFKKFIQQGRAIKSNYNSTKYKKENFQIYEYGQYALVFNDKDVLVTVLDMTQKRNETITNPSTESSI